MAVKSEQIIEPKDGKDTKPTEPARAGDPGYGLGIAGFVVSFFVGVAGLIMSAIALKQSKRADRRNGFALAGLIIGIVKTALDVLAIVGVIVGFVFVAVHCSQNAQECRNDYNRGYDNGYNYPDDNSSTRSQTY